jgi:hypothetical protein
MRMDIFCRSQINHNIVEITSQLCHIDPDVRRSGKFSPQVYVVHQWLLEFVTQYWLSMYYSSRDI